MIYGTDMGGFASGFVHKRIIAGAKGFFTGGPVGAAAAFLTKPPSREVSMPAQQLPPRRPPPRSTTARPSAFSAAEKEGGRRVKFANLSTAAPRGITDDGCVLPWRRDPLTGDCKIFFGGRSGPNGGPLPERGGRLADIGIGEAVMGRYGAALQPGSRIIDRAVCLRGMQLADDGLCYNRNQITNKQRMWPAGRKPLLTGGDMRAISTAARAGRRLEGATKRLQKIGLMKKPPPRRKLLTSGPTVHHHHEQ